MKPSSRTPAIALFMAALPLAAVPPAPVAQEGAPAALTRDLLGELEWRNIGPAISSGRVVDIDVPLSDRDVIYVASAAGGLFKTINRGTTWEPVFEGEGTTSIGAIAVAPSNPNVVWVGTGEANNQRSSSWGDGVYKSEDAGGTWKHMGLRGSQHVGGLAIDPHNQDRVFVAALGPLWGPGEERGLFRSLDGGTTWEKVLYISENTGVVDVAMDPRNPDHIYAAAYQRERRNWSFLGGGPEGGIYLSRDGGDSWTKLENGLPEPDIGKIGFAISPSDPDIVYAIVEAQDREQTGVYRSTDRGASWEHRNTLNPTPWYYSQIRVDPRDPDRIYVLGTLLSVSDDGGATFRDDGAPGIHVDHHAMWIDPDDTDRMLLGNDGGMHFTYDRGATWEFAPNLPITQFYHLAVDMREPYYYVCGGTQDNNTWCGPSGSRNADGVVNDDWYVTVGGDGFYAQVDPTNPDVVYSESQNGGLVRFDARTGERKRIQPQAPDGESYRWNWSAPLIISPHDHETIYFAANKVFRSSDRGDGWEVISEDLTRQLDRDELPMMGRNWPRDAVSRHSGVAQYGNITTLDESPLRAGVLAAGTDDGLISVSLDGGDNWTRIDAFPGVPELTRVSRLMWSHHSEGRLYVAFDGHKDNNFRPFLFRTEDHGSTWENISANLPEFGSTRVLREHPRNPMFLAAGTEFGVFGSIDGGRSWIDLGNNLPTVAVHDIVFHPRDNDLVIATHGRGFWILDDVAILEEAGEALGAAAHLASVRPALQFNRFDRGRDSQGARYFRAPNPPDGAILTYYLSPGAVAAPERGRRPPVDLEILDAEGEVVRSLQAPASAGIHRVIWDLRHEPPYEAEPQQGFGGFGFGGAPRGALALPGTYTARLRIGEAENESHLAVRRSVEVVADPLVSITDAELRARHHAMMQLSDLQGSLHAATEAAEGLETQLEAVTEALGGMPGAPAELVTQAAGLSERLAAILTDLRGGRGFPGQGGGGTPGISQVVGRLASGLAGYTAAPTSSETEQLAAAGTRLSAAVEQLNALLGTDVPALNASLDAAGVPWTPGRQVRLR